MDCSPAQKVRFGTHRLAEEADDWWLGTLERLEHAAEEISWNVFKREFLRKYFPEDVRGRKEMEFLRLAQGNMSVSEYAAKFIELAKYHPHYNGAEAEFSKCVKFEDGLRHDIKKAISYQRIRVFADLVDSCRIFEGDSNTSYKIVKENRDRFQNRSKPYDVSGGKGKQKAAAGSGKKPSGGDAPASVVCYKCGMPGHKRSECKTGDSRCFRCGKGGHMATECDRKDVVCFNCGEEGHVSTKCTKPKKEKGKVFALAGSEVTNEISGTCFIDGVPLIAIVDTGATHSFIAAVCVEKLNLELSSMMRDMVIDTPAKGSVTTSLMCAKCPLSVFGKDFVVDLICLPLRGMDIILGMDWLVHNHVHINCCDRSVSFSSPVEEEAVLLPGSQLLKAMRGEAQLFALVESLSVESQAKVEELPVVREFHEVFPDEIPDVPPEREEERD